MVNSWDGEICFGLFGFEMTRLNPVRVSHQSLGVAALRRTPGKKKINVTNPNGVPQGARGSVLHCATLSGFDGIECHQPGVRRCTATPGFVVERLWRCFL
ncbi:MAG: hypothetical protein WKF77_15520 [Planctomycetaceae bacterium]